MFPPVILCIDDSPDLLKLRKTTLESCGFSVEIATDAPTAMRTLETRSVASVLLDYKCEGVDAQAVAYLIKQRYPNKPIVLLSAYSCMPEALLWLVDEYVMRSEPVERLAQIILKVTRSSDIPHHPASAA